MLDVRLYILLSHTQIKISRTNFTHWYRQWHAYKHSPHRPPPATLLHSLWPGWIVCCHGNRILNTDTHTLKHSQTHNERCFGAADIFWFHASLSCSRWTDTVLSLRVIYNIIIVDFTVSLYDLHPQLSCRLTLLHFMLDPLITSAVESAGCSAVYFEENLWLFSVLSAGVPDFCCR